MNDAEPLLRLRGIGKNFGPVHALTDINLDIPAGQVTALVGDNGAGKSTLIKTISGIWEPNGGEILWQGKPVHFRSPTDATQSLDTVIHLSFTTVDSMFLVVTQVGTSRTDFTSLAPSVVLPLSSAAGGSSPARK